MFLEYYRLREQPFGVTPDPRYLFPSPGHREALASLLYGIESGLGFGALIAHPGMGKTTLLFHILEQYRDAARTAFIFNTQCNSYDLLRALLSELDEDASARDTFQLHEKFKQVLASEAQKGRRVILVIDEAQNLGDMVMETVRLLSNFESADVKLLHIILSGQPELAAKLGRPELRQLQQRIPMLTQLPCLSPQDVASYIDHRLRIAGHQGTPLFTPEAVRQIVWLSRGVPREINRLCFNSLSLAYASSKPLVDFTVLEEVAADLGLNDVLRQQREEKDQYQPVAVNSAPASAASTAWRPTKVWATSTKGPAPVETGGRVPNPPSQVAAGSPIPRTAQPGQPARPAGPFAVSSPRRSTLPPIQRVRRTGASSYGWQLYKRALSYALLCLGLIAGGWTVTHWTLSGSSAGAQAESTPAATSPSNDAAGPAPAAPEKETRRTPAQELVKAGEPSPNAISSSQPPAPEHDTAASSTNRRKHFRSNGSLASLRSPGLPVHSQSSPAVPIAGPNPAVKEPTVADQGQMEFVRYVRPHYPEEARNQHIEGTVVLSATVARDGTVRGIKRVSGDPSLLKAAETAIRDWVYRPYRINGRPVDVDTEIVINFALPRRLN